MLGHTHTHICSNTHTRVYEHTHLSLEMGSQVLETLGKVKPPKCESKHSPMFMSPLFLLSDTISTDAPQAHTHTHTHTHSDIHSHTHTPHTHAHTLTHLLTHTLTHTLDT